MLGVLRLTQDETHREPARNIQMSGAHETPGFSPARSCRRKEAISTRHASVAIGLTIEAGLAEAAGTPHVFGEGGQLA